MCDDSISCCSYIASRAEGGYCAYTAVDGVNALFEEPHLEYTQAPVEQQQIQTQTQHQQIPPKSNLHHKKPHDNSIPSIPDENDIGTPRYDDQGHSIHHNLPPSNHKNMHHSPSKPSSSHPDLSQENSRHHIGQGKVHFAKSPTHKDLPKKSFHSHHLKKKPFKYHHSPSKNTEK